ncbi:MAG: flagellin [Alphaproteobacteria bacterium]|nr:flagellin [Alphaproteobacteria bacterium]
MTRISTLSAQQAVVSQMLRAQAQLADDQRQVATGYKSDTFKGIARDASALISAQAIDSRTTQFIELGQQVGAVVSIQDTALSGIYDAAKGLRDSILGSLANNSGRTVSVDLDSAFVSGKAMLNTRYAGKFLFAGARSDVQPFNPADISTLATVATPIADFFQNSQQKAQVRIEQNVIVQHGVLASDMGLDMMASIKRMAEYDAATPFSEALTPADRAILQAEVANLDNVLSGIIKLQANNGFVANRIESVVIRQEALENVNKQLIADLSEVDMAEAITRFNRDQLAIEASYSLIRQLSQISLLNFL